MYGKTCDVMGWSKLNGTKIYKNVETSFSVGCSGGRTVAIGDFCFWGTIDCEFGDAVRRSWSMLVALVGKKDLVVAGVVRREVRIHESRRQIGGAGGGAARQLHQGQLPDLRVRRQLGHEARLQVLPAQPHRAYAHYRQATSPLQQLL